MKKTLIMIIAAAAALITASCSKGLDATEVEATAGEITNPTLEGCASLYASFEAPAMFGEGRVICQAAHYRSDGTLAIRLWKAEKDGTSPLTVLTTHLTNGSADTERAYIDTESNPWAKQFIEENGLGQITDCAAIRKGKLCLLVKFDTDRFKI